MEALERERLVEPRQDIPIACLLPADRLRERAEEVGESIFAGVEEKKELSDGYAFRFPGDWHWAERLFHFVDEERVCCPFFTFEISFEPGQGPIWLTLRGPEGTKEFIDTLS
jgi:hypothetical protein